jgi:hypothetical protein
MLQKYHEWRTVLKQDQEAQARTVYLKALDNDRIMKAK